MLARSTQAPGEQVALLIEIQAQTIFLFLKVGIRFTPRELTLLMLNQMVKKIVVLQIFKEKNTIFKVIKFFLSHCFLQTRSPLIPDLRGI